MAEIEGKIAKIVDEYTVILNVGSADGVKEGVTFVIFDQGDEVADPDTGESLGRWEIVKGRVMVSHVQERISTASTPSQEGTGPAGTLSAMMVEVSKGSPGVGPRREPLPIRQSDLAGRPQVAPIAIGDRIKSLDS